MEDIVDFIDFYDFFANVNNLEEEDDDLEVANEANERIIIRPGLRDLQNPVHHYTRNEFIVRYRFSQESVRNILLPIFEGEERVTRGIPVPLTIQLCCFLRFLATGNFQRVTGDLVGVSQPTISRLVKRMATHLCYRINQYIRFPTARNEIAVVKRAFHRVNNFPEVVTGVIDGTHVPIQSPGGDNAEVYRNRKGVFSLNIQVVGDPFLKITDIVARWPGSAHDSRIFENSGVYVKFNQGTYQGILLGDSGYPQSDFLYTPKLNPSTEAEIAYNNAHKGTRILIERLFGIWKRRFPCLSKKMATALQTTQRIIVSCAILHNISIDNGAPDELPQEENDGEDSDDDDQHHHGNRGHEIRDAFIRRYF